MEFFNLLTVPYTIQKTFTCQLMVVVQVITGLTGIAKESVFKTKYWTCLTEKLIVLIISK